MPTDGFQDAENDEGYWASLGKSGDRALFDNTVQNQYQTQLNRGADQAELDDWYNQGGELGHWGNLRTNLQGRATNTPGGAPEVGGGDGGDGGGNGEAGGEGGGETANGAYPGYPTPERSQFSTPERPSAYYSSYQPQYAEQFTGVGEDQRNRLMNAILAKPETMGQVQQDQLFEQQKELLNAQRAQQGAQLDQNLLRGGMSGLGGRARQGLQNNNNDFNSQLLAGRRDIAVQAAQQNRADTTAALQMQEAIAQGDSGRMMAIFNSNNQVRAQNENFLRQAASLTQSGTLGWNAQNLAAEQARHNENLSYYQFLEKQRATINQEFLNRTRQQAGTY